jgi:hypothetical protein
MPTKLKGRKIGRRRAVVSRAPVVRRIRSNHEGSSIAMCRESIFEVGPGTSRSIVSAIAGSKVIGRLAGDGMKGPNRFYAASILKLDVGRVPSVEYAHACR